MSRIYITTLLALILSGCSDPNIDYIKSARLDTDTTFTIEQAFDNRELCEGVNWISKTDNRDRVIVEYQCELIKPILVIKELDQKRLENKVSELENAKVSLNKIQLRENLEIDGLKSKIQIAEKELSENNEYLSNISGDLKNEIDQFLLDKPAYKNATSLKLKRAVSRLKTNQDDIKSINAKAIARVKNLKEQGYTSENRLVQFEESNIIKSNNRLSEINSLINNLEKLLPISDTLNKVSTLESELHRLNYDLESVQKRIQSKSMVLRVEKLKQQVEKAQLTQSREIASVKEVFKFAYTGDESFEVIEAGLVFELGNNGDIQEIYKKYNNRQLYLHVEDIYSPNGFASTIRNSHYSKL